jgi:two-component system, OmpR family, response regulator
VFPKTLAIIDDDSEYAEFLAKYLKGEGVDVTVFGDSDDFLVAPNAYDFDFYLVDLMLPGIDGVDLIRLLRKRVTSGIVAVSGRLGAEVFDHVLTAGADMHLSKPVRFEQVALAVKAVHRRSAGNATSRASSWQLDRKSRKLVAPDGVVIDLGENDLAVMECFLAADGGVVAHAELRRIMGREHSAEADNTLHATIYRLRRRIERATQEIVPLQSQARVGYVFRGKLIAA